MIRESSIVWIHPMKRNHALLVGIALAAMVSGCGKSQETAEPVSPPLPTYSAAQFFETTSISMAPSGGKAFSPDGESLLMTSDTTGIFNVYELPLSGASPVQLTDSPDNAMLGVSWFPGDKRVLFTYDSEGNELNHVVVREIDGSYHDLTPGDNLKAAFLGWSGDEQSFYLISTERNQQSFDIYRYSAADYSREMV